MAIVQDLSESAAVVERASEPANGSASGSASGSANVRATAALRTALCELGHPVACASVWVQPGGPDGREVRVVVAIPPAVPWRVADAAVARTLRQLRAADPDLRRTDWRFEDCAVTEG